MDKDTDVALYRAMETLKDVSVQANYLYVADTKGPEQIKMQLAILVTLNEILAELKAQRKA